MSALPNQPSSRLDFRISPEHKALIERAASAQGQTVSNFAIASLLKAAEEAIHSETQRVLSARDGRRFLAMLDAAGTPNAARRFYLKYGFTELADDPHHLFISMKTVRQLGLS